MNEIDEIISAWGKRLLTLTPEEIEKAHEEADRASTAFEESLRLTREDRIQPVTL